jgi:vacuolar-type H+-ATPase subunit B/Vma2
MKSAIGEKLTRKDHGDVSNQLVSCLRSCRLILLVRQVRRRQGCRVDEGGRG